MKQICACPGHMKFIVGLSSLVLHLQIPDKTQPVTKGKISIIAIVIYCIYLALKWGFRLENDPDI